MVTKKIKQLVVRLGPDSFPGWWLLSVYLLLKGFRLEKQVQTFTLESGARRLVLSRAQFVLIPWVATNFDLFFGTLESEWTDGIATLDFSEPSYQRYRSGVGFYFPSIPEDDVIEIYIREYRIQEGDVVWDVGAHAGASVYFLSRLVGAKGRVYAFEPDDINHQYLLRNIEHHGLRNVIPIKKAIGARTGTTPFNMDGSMAAGICDYLTYVDDAAMRVVDVITIADACDEYSITPVFIKMDIEGAEADAVRGSLEFIRDREIHFAIESGHEVGGALTCVALEELFGSIGYDVRTEVENGQVFTWASPRSSASRLNGSIPK